LLDGLIGTNTINQKNEFEKFISMKGAKLSEE